MSDKIAPPIDFILKSELGGVLAKAFAELYRSKPSFPVTYLANWLKDYNRNEADKKDHSTRLEASTKQYEQMEQANKLRMLQAQKVQEQQLHKQNKQQNQYIDALNGHEHLEELLQKWLPNYIEHKYGLSGVYVGVLTHPFKKVEPTNFQKGAEVDSESPKIIEYIGASDSQQSTMFMKVLPSDSGITFAVFNEPEPAPQQAEQIPEGDQPRQPKQPKKTYIYEPDVTKNEKIYYFKFPKLGSYACFPLKLKTVLSQELFDQAVSAYKEYVKQKEEAQKDYSEKMKELYNQLEQARKKYEEFEVPEEDPSPQQISQKKALEQQFLRCEDAYVEAQKNPPATSPPQFTPHQLCYVLGCDTLGQDKQIPQATLDEIDNKLSVFRSVFEDKQNKMLLKDILAYIEEEPRLQQIQNIYRDNQKNALAGAEQQAKQKGLKDKQLEYEIACTKAKRMHSVFQQPTVEKSMRTYFSYYVPKYTEVIQIALMLLGHKAQDINEPRKNTLDHRRLYTASFGDELLRKLEEFNLRPAQAGACTEEYKISKLLQRLEKIDLQQVGRYSGFIWVLISYLKSYCWALILCRDAKKEAYEHSIKAKEERDREIEKYHEQRLKLMEAAKAEMEPEAQETFSEQQWISNYVADNPEPKPMELIPLQDYLNID